MYGCLLYWIARLIRSLDGVECCGFGCCGFACGEFGVVGLGGVKIFGYWDIWKTAFRLYFGRIYTYFTSCKTCYL